jgi:hypothetical protein
MIIVISETVENVQGIERNSNFFFELTPVPPKTKHSGYCIRHVTLRIGLDGFYTKGSLFVLT